MAECEKYPLSPIDRERQLTSIKYMLFKLRYSQKRIARTLGISEATVGRIVKKHHLREQIKEMKAKGIKNSIKWDDSLTAFIVKLRIKNKELYKLVEPEYKQHLNTL